MKVLVTGSRNYIDATQLFSTLDGLLITHLVFGDARGADSLAKTYAEEHAIPHTEHRAHWDIYGRSAGSRRNQEMLDHHPDIALVVAFPLANSRGTYNMVHKAEQASIPILWGRHKTRKRERNKKD